MIYKLTYVLTSAATLGLLAFDAPSGGMLTSAPERPSVGSAPPGRTARGGGPAFIYLGGGYKGGK